MTTLRRLMELSSERTDLYFFLLKMFSAIYSVVIGEAGSVLSETEQKKG